MTQHDLNADLEFARELSLNAGELVMGYFSSDIEVDDKDGEPVTAADRASNDYILGELSARYPGDAILSEESLPTDEAWSQSSRCWVIDPLDGTSDFVAGREGFAVMIGLLVEGRPVLGAVHAPKVQRTFLGIVGEGATEERDGQTRSLHTSSRSSARELRVIASIAHRDARLERVIDLLEPAETLQVGSVGYKVGKIVSDEADLYVATTNRISLWDTCAPEAILHSAGGLFLNVDGDPLNYAGPGLTHERGLLATNGAATNDVVSRLAGVLPDLS